MTEAVKIENVTQEFPLPNGETLRVLNNISVTLPAQKTTALVGQSGSGKSTLMALMAGLEKLTSGKISIFGNSIHQMSEEQVSQFRAQNLGFVFQNFQLLNHFSALANVEIAAQIAGVKKAKGAALAELERVGLAHRVHHLPTQLSGGECQRVAIARALVSKPKLLLCDEPTGNLDFENAEAIFKLLLNAKETHKTTVIIVTHDSNLAEKCDFTVRLNKGVFQ